MKRSFFYIRVVATLFVVFMLFSCTGDDGAPGVAGATGATGATGAQGSQGIQGPSGADLNISAENLFITSAEWIDAGVEWHYFHPVSSVNLNVINTGVILTYWSNSDGGFQNMMPYSIGNIDFFVFYADTGDTVHPNGGVYVSVTKSGAYATQNPTVVGGLPVKLKIVVIPN